MLQEVLKENGYFFSSCWLLTEQLATVEYNDDAQASFSRQIEVSIHNILKLCVYKQLPCPI